MVDRLAPVWPPRCEGISTMGAGMPVRGDAWEQAASLQNFLNGRGTTLVAGGCRDAMVGDFAGPADIPYVFRFYAYPSSWHATYNWSITIARSVLSGYALVTDPAYGLITIGTTSFPFFVDGDASTYIIPVDYPDNHDLDPSTGSNFGEISCTITVRALSRIVAVYNITAYEAPNLRLSYGIATSSEQRGAPIYNGEADGLSIGGIASLMQFAEKKVCRGSLFSWCDPLGFPSTVGNGAKSNTFVDFFPIYPALQVRKVRDGETVRTVKVSVLAKQTAGTGSVKVTMTSGDTVTLSITSATYAWVHGDIDVETDDPSDLDNGGIRGGTRDLARIEWKSGNAANTLDIYSICINDPPGV